MGDERRSGLFALFIKKNFHKVKTILAVADGKGELARSLANKGFHVKVIEEKPRFVGRTHKRITYIKGTFSRNNKISEDIVVGMHPDEATGEIIRAAVNNNKPWAVVPCCIKGADARLMNSCNYTKWLTHLKTLGSDIRETRLKMQGKNIILYSNSKKGGE